MMNDRFSAQLRQHLLETANERPAEGQLAAVVDGVAVTAQRHARLARLPWFPGRIGSFPSAALRYGLVAVVLALATVVTAILVGGSARPSTVFEGTWTSTDPADGSTQTLMIGAGSTPAVHFEDAFATGDACVADTIKRFTADGTGAIAGNRLGVSFPDGGGCLLMKVELLGVFYDFDPGTDTLLDHQGLEWARVKGGDAPATQRPATQTPATEPPATPRPSPRAGEATFTSTIHGISIDYPAEWQTRPATEPWAGGELSFDSPAADVIFDPALGDRLFLVVASQPYGGLSQDAWRDRVLAWTCPRYSGGEMWSWRVDGAYAFQLGPCNSGSIIVTDTRGYLIRLVASSDEPGLADTYDWDWLKPVLETVDLRPEEALEALSPAESPSDDPTTEPTGPTATPSPSPSMSPRPGEATFTSTIHGISIDYPAGWQTRPATEPWTEGELSFDSLAADVIFDPALGDRLYLVVASQPYGLLSQDDWRDGIMEWICTGAGAFASWRVDGTDAFARECSGHGGAFVFTDTRGYLIWRVVSSDEPELVETYDWDWLKPLLETVDLRPEEALDAPGPSQSP